MVQVQGLDHIALAVRDVARSAEWYQTLFGLEERYRDVWHGEPTFLCAGSTCVALIQADEKLVGVGDLGVRHFAFRVDRENFERARQELERRGVEYQFDDHDVSWGLYLKDPDGHVVELACYDVLG